jgi:hypothetical protein
MQAFYCRDNSDPYYKQIRMPAGQFLPVRGMILGVFEDLPQLAVQLWVFSTNKQGSDEFSTGSLLFALGMTVLNILHQTYLLWKRAALLRVTNLSLWRHLGILFGFVRGSREVSKVYAKLIFDGNYPDSALAINGWLIGGGGCKELVDAIESHHCRYGPRKESIVYINFAFNDIGNDGATRIAAAITRGVPLIDVNLAYNKIDDAGMPQLVGAMKLPICRLHLNLTHNDGITDIGYAALVDAAKNCNSCISVSQPIPPARDNYGA